MVGNRYYRVKAATPVWIKTGWKGSNCYYGSSQIFQATYAEATAKRGDQIHKLVGGTFLVRKDGTVAECQLSKPIEKSPFEKNYGGTWAPELPATLVEIAQTAASRPASYRGAK